MGEVRYNFSAGPAPLPAPVRDRIRDELDDFAGSGQSILELPFSAQPFRDLIARAERDLRELLDISADYAVLFLQGGASAQKNIGVAGLTVLLVRRDLLGRAHSFVPAVFDYTRQADAASLLNTPPIFAVYVAGLAFEWLKNSGGVRAMEEASLRKSAILYRAIDSSEGFYRCPVLNEFRSRVNVCFRLADELLTERFLDEAQDQGLLNLKGHSKLGGVRASLYNAMPEEGAAALAGFMADFANRWA
jgi:phosphoserine aminotransferase